jgi:hypothetical protein
MRNRRLAASALSVVWLAVVGVGWSAVLASPPLPFWLGALAFGLAVIWTVVGHPHRPT